FVDVKAVVTRVLIFLLHDADDGVWDISEIDRLANRGTARKELLAYVGSDKCHVAGLRKILIVVEAAFAHLDRANFGKGRGRTCDGQRPRIVGAMDEYVSLSELRDNVLTVCRLFAHDGQVHIIEAHASSRAATTRLHAGASGKDNHHIAAEGACHF